MIRLFHVYFASRTVLLALSEVVLTALALLAATFVWFGPDTDLALRYDYGPWRMLFAALVCVLCMYYYDLYDSAVLGNLREISVRLVQVLGTVCVVLSVIYYTYPVVQLDRGPFLIWIALVGVWLMLWRRLFVALNRSLHLGDRALLLGAGPLARPLAAEIEKRPEYGVQLLGYVEQEGTGSPVASLRRLGTLADLFHVVEREGIRRIILSMGDRRGRLPVAELLKLKTSGVMIQDAADVYEALTGRVPLDSLRLSWLLFSSGFRVSPWMLLYKRTASIVLSLAALLVTLPLIVLVAIAIRLDSKGPVIFRQKRVGKGGKIFLLYKFRSMVENADPNAPAQKDDPRVTRVGRWIRRVRIDELPQLYNILRGDMYFVGPRPFVPQAEEECVHQIPIYDQRWSVKPGATGWAQVKGGYCATLDDNIEKLSYDLFYIKNMSIGLDCLILFETVKILLLGRGAR